MRFVSLFAGIGGIDLGLERAGMECVAQVEWDPWCTRVLEKHWPDTPRWEDIHDLDPKELPDHDLIAGGFPCQPVSTAGKRLAQDDPRWLWPEFSRVVRVVRPRYVLVENVPGLLTAGFDDVQADLAAYGYDTEWIRLSAADVGAPHLRRRIFLIAHTDKQQHESGSSEIGRQTPTVLSSAYPPGDLRGTPGDERPEALDGRRTEMADPDEVRWGGWPRVFGPGRRTQPANRGSSESGWWAVEPDVGESPYGVPRRLDYPRQRVRWPTPTHGDAQKFYLNPSMQQRVDRRLAGEKYPRSPAGHIYQESLPEAVAYAAATETGPPQDVQPLWDDPDQEAFWWSPRGPRCLPPQALLQSGLYGESLCQRHVAAGLQTQTNDALPWPDLRELWNHDDASRPSHRRELEQRLTAEHPDLMRELSRHSPPPCPACWVDGSWEDGIDRVATGVPSRADRLRGLGNAVVPQVAEHIGRLILGQDNGQDMGKTPEKDNPKTTQP